MTFRNVFIAVFVGTALIVAAMLINRARPRIETAQPGPEYVRASGKCATCHSKETSAIVHQFSMSAHAKAGITCYDCHSPQAGQQQNEHNGFTLAKTPNASPALRTIGCIIEASYCTQLNQGVDQIWGKLTGAFVAL